MFVQENPSAQELLVQSPVAEGHARRETSAAACDAGTGYAICLTHGFPFPRGDRTPSRSSTSRVRQHLLPDAVMTGVDATNANKAEEEVKNEGECLLRTRKWERG